MSRAKERRSRSRAGVADGMDSDDDWDALARLGARLSTIWPGTARATAKLAAIQPSRLPAAMR